MNIMIDELFITSALEMYCAAILIQKGYIAHEIANNELKKEQKKRPIKISEIGEINEKMIQDKTIGISTLLNKQNYFTLFELNNKSAFCDIVQMRNKIHFHLFIGKEIKKNYLDCVFELYQKLLDKNKVYDNNVFLKNNLLRQKYYRMGHSNKY